MRIAWDGTDPGDVAKARVLNFSGGRESTKLALLSLAGELPLPELVLTADPGMEDSRTYPHVSRVQELFRGRGVEAVTVDGPNLYDDLRSFKKEGRTRFDTPPYWTVDVRGRVGRLHQECTYHYKIAPMDRYLRSWMEENLGIGRKSKAMGHNVIEKWIGFSANERSRVSPPRQKYVYFRYPLMEVTDVPEITELCERFGLEVPPRSVCNACFANTPEHFREMAAERPEDFAQAVAVDETVRDMRQVGVHDTVYVSRACVPLTDLVSRLHTEDKEEWSCDSGYCFL